MDAENEAKHLRWTLHRAREMVPELKAALAAAFAPRQAPRPEVLFALRLLATQAGLPGRCARQECRRAGLCQAKDVGDPPCDPLWPEPLADQLEDMAIGIALSAWCRERQQAETHAWLVRMLELPAEDAPPKRRKPSRPGA
jgi:hypothetical protein